MKRIYNSMLDRKGLSHNAEGLRVYNNQLAIIQYLHRRDRARILKKMRILKQDWFFWQTITD